MSKSHKNWIAVVTALIKRDGQVLMGQRPQHGTLPGVWEFPGGKIEFGESPEQALHRELHEELAIDAEVGALKLASTHHYGENLSLLLLFYEVLYWKGQPKAKHHTEIQWANVTSLKNLPLPEANQRVLNKLLEILNG